MGDHPRRHTECDCLTVEAHYAILAAQRVTTAAIPSAPVTGRSGLSPRLMCIPWCFIGMLIGMLAATWSVDHQTVLPDPVLFKRLNRECFASVRSLGDNMCVCTCQAVQP